MKNSATLVCMAVTFAALTAALKMGTAAEPVDVFVPPAKTTPGTTAAILPPGTYHAVRQDGVKLSGLIHAPDLSGGFTMPSRKPSALWPLAKTPKHNPGLRFVPVSPAGPGITLIQPSR